MSMKPLCDQSVSHMRPLFCRNSGNRGVVRIVELEEPTDPHFRHPLCDSLQLFPPS